MDIIKWTLYVSVVELLEEWIVYVVLKVLLFITDYFINILIDII